MISVLKKIYDSHRFSLIILLLIQWYSFVFNDLLPVWLNALLFTGGSMGFGIMLLRIYFNKAVGVSEQGQTHGGKARMLLTLLGIAAIAAVFYLLSERFNAGAYLSLQPGTFSFLMSELLTFDYRWIPLSIWSATFILLMFRSMKYNSAVYHLLTILFGISPVLFMSVGTNPLHEIMTDGVSTLLSAYYILLVMSVNVNKPVLRGLIVGLCLMAGFGPVLWLPLAALILWQNEQKQQLYRSMISLLIFITGIYIAYLLYDEWGSIFNAYRYNNTVMLDDWWHKDSRSGKPFSMHTSFGFTSLVFESLRCSNSMKFSLIKSLNFWSPILCAAIMFIAYFRLRNKIHYKIFLMGSFKICMAVFMFFSLFPYPGLMLIDLFVSIAIFAETGKYHFAGSLKKESHIPVLKSKIGKEINKE